jgi:beta-fructofuranosidase
MGDWWYLIYSTFSERNITHYRMSRSLADPWLAPTNDSFDGRAFYAAKTASDGQRRFIYGWDPTRTDESDSQRWNWGGHLVVHEVFQQPDGSLTVQIPPEVADQFTNDVPIRNKPEMGRWSQTDTTVSADAESSFAWMRVAPMPQTSMIETTITFTEATRYAGVILRADDALNRGYQMRLEPGLNRVVFDRFPRPGDEPPIIERPVPLTAGEPVHLRILVEGSVIVAYVNGQVALSTRGYEHADGSYGLFVSEGGAVFSDTRVRECSARA